MRIIHRISVARDEPIRQPLERLGIRLEPGFSVFEVEESDPLWVFVQELLKEYEKGLSDIVSTEFTKKELESAELLVVEPSWHWSYPQPERDFEYLKATYDLTNFCEECGIGKVQKAPFRLRSQPAWGRRNILQLNWVFDEFFVTQKAYEEFFKPLGIGNWPVVKNKGGSVLDDVIQLRIDTIAKAPLNVEGLKPESCQRCGRIKFNYVMRGPSPEFRGNVDDALIMKTQEYFGSGSAASKEVVITKKLYTAMVKYGMKGVEYSPLGPPLPQRGY